MSASTAEKPKPTKVVIKKYANRRLYNTAKSSYVTLDDLSQMVRGGQDFAVFDAKSGEDITRSVLTQIIFEEESKGQQMLPTNFLRQLISLYGDALQGVVPGYLDASMEAFGRNQERMREVFGTAQAVSTFETLARSNMEWFEQAMKMFAPFAGGPAAMLASRALEKPAKPAPSVLSDDLEALQRQLHAMQSQLERLTKEKG